MATPTPETAIWLALRARVVSLSLSPDLQIAFPDGQEDQSDGVKPFTPPQDSKGKPTDYLEVSLLRNDTDAATMGSTGKNRHMGILQIMLHTRKDQHFAVGTEIAGDIADHFKLGTTMTNNGITVRVERPPSVGSDISNSNEPLMMIPISIRWTADANRS